MKKYFVLPFLLFYIAAYITCFAQEKNANAELLEAPANWSKESFELPPTFAPKINFTGIEQVRFAPGWADQSSPQFWTYTFAWYLDGQARLSTVSLTNLVEEYFSGLTASVGKSNGIDAQRITKSTASFTQTGKSAQGHFFEGKVELYDVFFTREKIKLQVKVKEIYCSMVNKHVIVFSLSPKNFQHEVWKLFDNVRTPRDCSELPVVTQETFTTKKTQQYELIIPKGKQNGVLLLFPGFPETPQIIKSEFKILEPALSKGIAVALMAFNQKIWLEDTEKTNLSAIIQRMFEENNLSQTNVYIGGFSSGGNVSLLIGNHLMKSQKGVKPKGIFIIDSPVDILGLYENAQKNVERNFSPVSVQESKMIISLLESNFGKPQNGIENYEEYGVYTTKTHNINNLASLTDVKIRLYTEPDTVWWKQERMYEYEEMNAYFIKNLYDDLSKKFGPTVEYIPTQNRGYRSNGERHPHSWSIVDVDGLLKWMMAE